MFKTLENYISINEAAKQKFDFGCVMLDFDFIHQLEEIQSKIEASDLYTKEGDRSYGFEKEPHCTLLYGLHAEVSSEDVYKAIQLHKFSECMLGDISCFSNPEYDVLKFSVGNDELAKVNARLREFPHTSNFPDYVPHLTIAYLKPGSAAKYVDMFKHVSYLAAPITVTYSMPDGSKDSFSIN